ncbi:MAG: hypothetical protein WC008_03370 [Bacilli bacterium]|jgi:hypothetical protein
MKKNILLILLFLVLHFITVLFITDVSKINIVTILYLVSTIAVFGLAYLDTVNIVKLGFGITRKSIYINFSKNLLIYITILLVFSLYNALLYKIVYKDYNFLVILNPGMLLYFSINIFSFGQIGLLFGNIRINKIIGSIIFLILLSANFLFALIFQKYLIVNVVLLLLGFCLIFVNYRFIIEGKFERSK